ncbi:MULTISPECIES: hypothetical protein [Bifidobacterium]|jgi:hypothetical protein|uniref:hypothetical protein n=1 Tax=Bifidobacterium TaxID=1678 RepID=UPI000F4C72FD|nr:MULTISPECIES: hypothetical protein [Bifidobacterium]MCI1225376.1 hypothetical protein [Bifidobacterium sp.]
MTGITDIHQLLRETFEAIGSQPDSLRHMKRFLHDLWVQGALDDDQHVQLMKELHENPFSF